MSNRQVAQQKLLKSNADEKIVRLVLAAFDGQAEIERVLAGEDIEIPEATPDNAEVIPDSEGQVPHLYLRDITVSGFRGIGPETKLEILPGPGLTVVVGRNGSGKSSFSDALEFLLTEDSYRWKGKGKIPKNGWKNLHHGGNSKITARFQVEGTDRLAIVGRTWNHSSKLEEAEIHVQYNGQSYSNLDEIGWREPLYFYRPILSYDELNIAGQRPIDLYNTIFRVLGLGELFDVVKELENTRNERRAERGFTKLNKNIVLKLDELADEGAKKKISDAISTRDLEVIKEMIDGRESDLEDLKYEDLRLLRNIRLPNKEEVMKVANEIRNARISLADLSGTEPEQAEKLVLLLTKALEHYTPHYDKACPVCGAGKLDVAWRADVLKKIEGLEDTAKDYREAEKSMDSALKEARRMVSVPELPVSDVVDTGELISAWKQWGLLLDNEDEDNVTEHLLSQYSVVRDEVTKVSEEASQRFSDRADKWNAFMPELVAWYNGACEVDKEEQEVVNLERAGTEVKTIISELQEERLSNIKNDVLQLSNQLRLDSKINLRSVKLTGSLGKGQGEVNLPVEIEGIGTEALSVSSQGELSCLALSLFFPRAMVPASPFRFIVIDDPIQSMDLARVRALARVFAKIAEDRQLIVFTHDDRLSESLRIASISHRCLKVTREPKSVIEIKETHDPVKQAFEYAVSIMNDAKRSEDVVRQVIPGLCRVGLEAACVEAIWRNLGKVPHTTIEKRLSNAHTLDQKASLALFGKDVNQEKILNKIQDEWREDLRKAYENVNEGIHPSTDFSVDDLPAFIDDCKCLAEKLRSYNV